MCLNNLFSILCFIFVVSFGFVSTQKCGDSMFFRPNGTYDTNRRLLLSTLASNVSSRNNRFYNVSVGEGPGRIYALGLCIPGTDPKVCSDCIQLASEGLLQNCPNQTDSFDWRANTTLCFVRYSNSSFFNKIDLEPTIAVYSNTRFQGNLTTYNRTWDALMNFMITRIGQSQYLADVSPQIGSDRIYTLMQCIPGLSANDCETCILVSVRNYQRCCNGFLDGVVRKPVCFCRWENYAYLGAFGDTSSRPPQESQRTPLPPPQADGKMLSVGDTVAIVVSAVTFLLL